MEGTQVPRGNCNALLQDYNSFFTAVECETLFRYLDLEVPTDEMEFHAISVI